MKTNRIWSQRSEAIAILASDPTISGEALVAKLFNCAEGIVATEVKSATKPLVVPVPPPSLPAAEPSADAAAALAAEVDARLASV